MIIRSKLTYAAKSRMRNAFGDVKREKFGFRRVYFLIQT